MEFSRLAELCLNLEKMHSRKEMINLVAEFFKNLEPKEVKPAACMLAGQVPQLGVGWSTLKHIVLEVTGAREEELFRLFQETGDLGEAVYRLLDKKGILFRSLDTRPLAILEVWDSIQKVTEISGESSVSRKRKIIEGLFLRCSPAESRLLTKLLIGEMRMGFSEGLLLPALAKAYSVDPKQLHLAWSLTSLAEVSEALACGRDLSSFHLKVFRPIQPMLAHQAQDLKEVLHEHQGRTYLEFKLDGARVQVHKKLDQVRIFSRGPKDVTQSMPEVVEQCRELELKEGILEGEVVALREGKPLPFQFLLRRFRREREIRKLREEVPLRLWFFDILFLEGKSLLELPYSERRSKLEEVAGDHVIVNRLCLDLGDAEDFLKQALDAGHEGVMAKHPSSPYVPGRREKCWLKVKKTLTLDLVVVGAEWGHGRRAKFLSDYYLAALDPKTGKFEVVGKTFKGLTDQELEHMTRRLKQLEISSQGRTVWVRPEVVVEVSFNQVQRSPKYPCGMALRFARIKSIREDKKPEEADTLDQIRKLAEEE